ncbi:DUF2187 domain-containing protein [Sporosarcina sp. P18a]|uniref:YkvS family protein n=1 Tax=unclassified Sporosarcina TaxID=2647733 RepID=UPI000C17394D|nr:MULTISPECIES: DUF2187 family protein [unclassified Sporosarcina]PIC71655.1 DUF2187 domain-containing protein [Sporosarcina sp. P16b]PIC81540.1 DUF2187 domain-containing protein [Sporosarcina sp. P18a]PID01323.1 DUF2187 domain-containing protein [Sporosarcina sp. P2]PID25903.1 DUF2187 domain-containing protein [Sporosarcina sp. P7]
MTIAEIGDIIEFKEGLQGIVEKVNENSVIVDLTYMKDFDESVMQEKTVINHKRYIILSSSSQEGNIPRCDPSNRIE